MHSGAAPPIGIRVDPSAAAAMAVSAASSAAGCGGLLAPWLTPSATHSLCHAMTRKQLDAHRSMLRSGFSAVSLNKVQPESWKPIIDKLLESDQSKWFADPVDHAALRLPDYCKIVRRRMDLGTIRKALDRRRYTSADAFARDVRQTFYNARLYNPYANAVHQDAIRLTAGLRLRACPALLQRVQLPHRQEQTVLRGPHRPRALVHVLLPQPARHRCGQRDHRPQDCAPQAHPQGL